MNRWQPERRYGGKLSDHLAQSRNAQIEFYAYCMKDVMARPVSYDAVVRGLVVPYGSPPCTFRSMLHFVGFKDDRYWNAVRAFGKPDFVHRHWDQRAVAEVMPGDTVVFADGDEAQPVTPWAYDDSAFF